MESDWSKDISAVLTEETSSPVSQRLWSLFQMIQSIFRVSDELAWSEYVNNSEYLKIEAKTLDTY